MRSDLTLLPSDDGPAAADGCGASVTCGKLRLLRLSIQVKVTAPAIVTVETKLDERAEAAARNLALVYRGKERWPFCRVVGAQRPRGRPKHVRIVRLTTSDNRQFRPDARDAAQTGRSGRGRAGLHGQRSRDSWLRTCSTGSTSSADTQTRIKKNHPARGYAGA